MMPTATPTKMTDSARPVAQRIRCPRCGYDLRGAVATWTHECPMEGVCTECGLEFEWRELLNPEYRRPTWNIEFARTIRGFMLCCAGTTILMLWPWKFWRDVRMTHAARWSRIAGFLVICLFAQYAVFAIAQAARTIQARQVEVQMVGNYLNMANRAITSEIGMGRLPATTPRPRIVSETATWKIVLKTLILPLSDEPSGELITVGVARPNRFGAMNVFATNQRETWELPAPIQQVLPYDSQGASAAARSMAMWAILFPSAHIVLIPSLFALLPITRRTFRIRARHLIRISLYALAFVNIPMGVLVSLGVDDWASTADRLPEDLGWACFFITPTVVFIWWGVASAIHLRLRHGWWTAGAFSSVAWMLLMICGYLGFIQNRWGEVLLRYWWIG